jgi:hypothetical protein
MTTRLAIAPVDEVPKVGIKDVQDSMNVLPDTIDLGYRKYTFMLVSQDDLDYTVKSFGSLGAHHGHKAQLLISKSKHSNGAELVNTVLHEVSHAAMALYGPGEITLEDEEACVSAIANGITELFRRNPSMLDWVKDSLEV